MRAHGTHITSTQLRSSARVLHEMVRYCNQRTIEYHEPHITVGSEITLEWWHGKHKLTLDVDASGVVLFTKVWGPNVFTEMRDGVVAMDRRADDDIDLGQLWHWLICDEEGEQ